jgi:glycine/D-amino acid oxidase-like deaminating enzyme
LEVGPELHAQWGGSVQWASGEEDAAKLKSQVAMRESFGDPIHLIDVDTLDALLPGVVTGAVKAAAFADIEATIDPVATTNVLLAHAEKWGAKLVYPCEVTAMQSNAGKIQAILTTRGKMEADYYVLAAGVGSMSLAQQAGVQVPLIEKPGILAHSKPMPRILDRVLVLPIGLGLGLKQNPDPDGRFVTGGHFGNHGELEPTAELGMQMLGSAATFEPRLKDAELDFMTLGHSVMPKDGLPIAGVAQDHSNLFVAAMDSGVTLAPLMGRLASIELLDGVATTMLDPYRTSRFRTT